MAKHIHIHTHDYGTSEGAKKAAATRAHGGASPEPTGGMLGAKSKAFGSDKPLHAEIHKVLGEHGFHHTGNKENRSKTKARSHYSHTQSGHGNVSVLPSGSWRHNYGLQYALGKGAAEMKSHLSGFRSDRPMSNPRSGDTKDYGTSEGAKKRWQHGGKTGGAEPTSLHLPGRTGGAEPSAGKSTLSQIVEKHGMNSPQAHEYRARLREIGENKAGYKASMQRQGKSEYAKRMANASPRYKELAETSPLKAHLAGQTFRPTGVGVRGIPGGTYKPTGGYGGGRDSNKK